MPPTRPEQLTDRDGAMRLPHFFVGPMARSDMPVAKPPKNKLPEIQSAGSTRAVALAIRS
jgi:hypothetical protein